jgi:hypothetical protein
MFFQLRERPVPKLLILFGDYVFFKMVAIMFFRALGQRPWEAEKRTAKIQQGKADR